MAEFLRSVITNREWIPRTPKAIVIISAHWEESVASVGYQSKGTSLIYDYYGFPEETYAPHLTWPAPTDLIVADRVLELLKEANIPCSSKQDRGFDHGVFIPLKLAIPDASIPVIQVSLQSNLDPAYHIRLGQALAPLRQEDILVLGSGAATHNLDDIRRSPSNLSQSVPHVQRFTEWLRSVLEVSKQDTNALSKSRTSLENMHTDPTIASDLVKCHPRTEHLIPLHVVFGSAIAFATKPYVQSTNITCDASASPMSASVSQQQQDNLLGKRIFQQTVGAFALDCYLFP